MAGMKTKDMVRDTVLLSAAVLLFLFAQFLSVLNVGAQEAAVKAMLVSIAALNVAVFACIFSHIRRDFALFVFMFAFNLLLLGRVYVSWIGNYEQILWLLEADGYPQLFQALRIVFVSLLCVFLSYRFSGAFFARREAALEANGDDRAARRDGLLPVIRRLSELVLWVSSVPFFYTLLLTVRNVLQNGYLASFTETNQVEVPSVIGRLSMFFVPAFTVFLATLPNKRQIRWPLVLYAAYMLASLFTGRRNTMVREVLMLAIYFVMRDNLLEKAARVLKKSTVAAAAGLGIAAMYFLQLFAQMRAGIAGRGRGLGEMLVGFFNSQGASFRVIIQTVNHLDWFPAVSSAVYLFYPLERFVHNNIITRTLFGLSPIIELQNTEFARTTHNFAHVITYMVDPVRYLSGGGFGTSYVAESYAAYRMAGVILVSVLIGLAFRFLSSLLTRSWIVIACGLLALKDFVYMPRDFAFSWISDVFNITYFCFYAVLYLGAVFLVSAGTHVRPVSSGASRPPYALEGSK